VIEPYFIASDAAMQQAIGMDCAIVQPNGNWRTNVFAEILC
jgi:hypothetical protein